MDKLAEYGKKLNNYVLKNEGDIFELKKLADELNRDFYKDIIELKVGYNLWSRKGVQYGSKDTSIYR